MGHLAPTAAGQTRALELRKEDDLRCLQACPLNNVRPIPKMPIADLTWGQMDDVRQTLDDPVLTEEGPLIPEAPASMVEDLPILAPVEMVLLPDMAPHLLGLTATTDLAQAALLVPQDLLALTDHQDLAQMDLRTALLMATQDK